MVPTRPARRAPTPTCSRPGRRSRRARRRSSTCATAPPTSPRPAPTSSTWAIRVCSACCSTLPARAAADRHSSDPHRRLLCALRAGPGRSRLHGDDLRREPAARSWIAPARLCSAAAILCGLATLLFRWRKDRRQRFFTAWSTRLTLAAPPGWRWSWSGCPTWSTGSITSPNRELGEALVARHDRLDRRRLPRPAGRGVRPGRAPGRLQRSRRDRWQGPQGGRQSRLGRRDRPWPTPPAR